jgi:hypothetical protein
VIKRGYFSHFFKTIRLPRLDPPFKTNCRKVCYRYYQELFVEAIFTAATRMLTLGTSTSAIMGRTAMLPKTLRRSLSCQTHSGVKICDGGFIEAVVLTLLFPIFNHFSAHFFFHVIKKIGSIVIRPSLARFTEWSRKLFLILIT